jgi:hypothetical protein
MLDESKVLMVVVLEGKLLVKAMQNMMNDSNHDEMCQELLQPHMTSSGNFHLTRIHHKMDFVQMYVFDY